VDHLEELRTRLIVSLLAVAVAFGFCFWQNHQLLHLVNSPLAHNTSSRSDPAWAARGDLLAAAERSRRGQAAGPVVGVLQTRSEPAASRTALTAVQTSLGQDVSDCPRRPRRPPGHAGNRRAVTHDGHRHAAVRADLFASGPADAGLRLLHAGVRAPAAAAHASGGHVDPGPVRGRGGVRLPPSCCPRRCTSSRTSTAASSTCSPGQPVYKFAARRCWRWAVVPVPVAIIAVTRAVCSRPGKLRRNRRWAVLACCGVAAILPGDAITMLLETLPLYFLFEFSVLIGHRCPERRERRRAAAEQRGTAGPG